MAGPISLIATILSGFLVGFFYLIALLFSVQVGPGLVIDLVFGVLGGVPPPPPPARAPRSDARAPFPIPRPLERPSPLFRSRNRGRTPPP